jgi:hypothetical protein
MKKANYIEEICNVIDLANDGSDSDRAKADMAIKILTNAQKNNNGQITKAAKEKLTEDLTNIAKNSSCAAILTPCDLDHSVRPRY